MWAWKHSDVFQSTKNTELKTYCENLHVKSKYQNQSNEVSIYVVKSHQAGISNSFFFFYVILSHWHTMPCNKKRNWGPIHEKTLDALKGCHFQMMSWYHLCTIVLPSPIMKPQNLKHINTTSCLPNRTEAHFR